MCVYLRFITRRSISNFDYTTMVLQDGISEKLMDKDLEGRGFDIILCIIPVFAMMYCVKPQKICRDKQIRAKF